MPRIDTEHACVAAEKVWSKHETTANSIEADYVLQMVVLDLGPLMELRRCRYSQMVDTCSIHPSPRYSAQDAIKNSIIILTLLIHKYLCDKRFPE